jgi:hypothetical protein
MVRKVNPMIISYHGCRQEDLAKLIAGQIDVSLGGGELGRGFYTTLSFYTAKEWAWHKYKSLTVLEIAISDQDFYDLDPLVLTPEQTYAYRRHIRAQARVGWTERSEVQQPSGLSN